MQTITTCKYNRCLDGFDKEFMFINEEVNVHLSSVNQLIYTCTI